MNKEIYSIVIYPKKNNLYYTYLPALDRGVQGESLSDCMEKSRELIAVSDKKIDTCDYKILKEKYPNCIVTLIDVNKKYYRNKILNRAVKRSVTLPFWLDEMAKDSGLNVSSILKNALIKELNG